MLGILDYVIACVIKKETSGKKIEPESFKKWAKSFISKSVINEFFKSSRLAKTSL